MSPTPLTLRWLPGRWAVCQLAPDAPLPAWAVGGAWFSATRTADELSLVCAEADAPATVRAERGWQALQVAGPLEFSLVGILAALTAPLAEAGVSVFAVSTYDTDYLLVKAERAAEAARVLRAAGHHVIE